MPLERESGWPISCSLRSLPAWQAMRRHRGWDPAQDQDSGPAPLPSIRRRASAAQVSFVPGEAPAALTRWEATGAQRRAGVLGDARRRVMNWARPEIVPGARRRRPSTPRVARVFCLEPLTSARNSSGHTGEESLAGRVSSRCGLASREIIRGHIRALGLLCQFDPKLCHGKQGGTVLIRHRLCQVLTFLCVSPVGLRVVSHHWPFPT